MTIINLFENAVAQFPDNAFLWEKTTDKYLPLTYSETYSRVRKLASGLLALGIQKNDKVILLSEGRNEWVIAELGVLFAGGVCVPVSVKIDELPELQFRIMHSDSRFIIVSGKNLNKIQALLPQSSGVEKVIVFDEEFGAGEKLISFQNVMAMGETFDAENPYAFPNAKNKVLDDDIANICYTSGTTADPKGILLTHNNYCTNAAQSCSLFHVPEWYLSLMILPWDHSFAHTVGIYTLMMNGASLASVQQGKTQLETIKNLSNNIKETQPVFLLSVPALAKNFKNNIEKGIKEKGAFANALFRVAMRLAYFYNADGYSKGRGFRAIAKPLLWMFDRILFKKIRAQFGGRLAFFVGGGALLDMEFQKFFYAIGIPMYQGYGLTEASPVISSNTPDFHKLGTSGKPAKDMDVRICDEKNNALPVGEKGEIVIRGGNVMAGYWKNPATTAETLRNGWLYTGDLGFMDADGFLTVLGRFKSLLISSDGEKYSPEAIEEALESHSPYIKQVMLYNNQQNYTVALVVPDFAELDKHLTSKFPQSTKAEYTEKAIQLIRQEINQYNEGGQYAHLFPKRWIPSTFALLSDEFTEQNRLINSTMKMVRPRIIAQYQSRIDYMYTAEGKDVLNEKNRGVF